jgi:hypothetical protein
MLYMPTFKSRVTCCILKKKHVFWKPPALCFCWFISKLSFANKSVQKHSKHLQFFISRLVNSSLYSWQSFSLTTQPQTHSTSAWINRKMLILLSLEHELCYQRVRSNTDIVVYCERLYLSFQTWYDLEERIFENNNLFLVRLLWVLMWMQHDMNVST